MAAGSDVYVQLERGSYALVMLLVSVASGVSEGARFKLHSKKRRMGAE